VILEWLPQALLDFYEIIDFIATENPVAAVEQGDEIESQVAMLLDNHHMGRPGRVKMTRELVLVRTLTLPPIESKGRKSKSSGFYTVLAGGQRDFSRLHQNISPLRY
jgi:plasmid stabilization system protein ParE